MCCYDTLQVPLRHQMTQRVNLYLRDDFADFIKSKMTGSLSLSAFCSLLIEKGLETVDSSATIPAYRVGAEDSYKNSQQIIEPAQMVELAVERKTSSLDIDGRGVGRESEGNPRGPRKDRVISDELLQHGELIEIFWKLKGGSRGSNAWSLLMTELKKILKAHGHDIVRQQLELAVNGKWKGITLANYNRFLPAGKNQQPEAKHPASRVFTAKDGFAADASNPALKDLF